MNYKFFQSYFPSTKHLRCCFTSTRHATHSSSVVAHHHHLAIDDVENGPIRGDSYSNHDCGCCRRKQLSSVQAAGEDIQGK